MFFNFRKNPTKKEVYSYDSFPKAFVVSQHACSFIFSLKKTKTLEEVKSFILILFGAALLVQGMNHLLKNLGYAEEGGRRATLNCLYLVPRMVIGSAQ